MSTTFLSYSFLLGNDLGSIREIEELCVVLRGRISSWQVVEYLIDGVDFI